MLRIFYFTCFFSLLCFPAKAQSPVFIKVSDTKGLPIISAEVKLLNKSMQVVVMGQTDDAGELRLVPAYDSGNDVNEPFYLNVSADGYSEKKIVCDTAAAFNIVLEKNGRTLDEVVVTGVGKPTKLSEAVSIYKIISQEDIRNQGAVTLDDAIRNQLGLNVGNDQMLGSSVTMRGLSGNNVKILIDGLPVNGRENGNIDLTQFSMYNIDHIEIVQGPMSVMYGSDALGGVINLITKKADKKLYTGVNAFYETIGKYNLAVNNAMKIGKSNYYINLARNFFQGWDPADKDRRDPLWRPKEQYIANFKYTYNFNKNAAITYSMDFTDEKLTLKGDTAGYSYYTRTTNDEYFYTKRWINRLQAHWKTGENGYWETNNSFANYNRERKDYIIDLSNLERTPATALGDNSTTAFNDFTSRTTFNNKVGIFSYTVGYDINIEKAKGVDKLSSDVKTIGDYALFLMTEFKATPELTIMPALRGGYNNSYTAPLVPSLSFLYKPTLKCSLRGSYARGFRAPSLKELYLDFKDDNHDIVGNRNLKAEYGNHYQLSAAYNIFNREKQNGVVSLTGYYDDVRNQIALAVINNDSIPVSSVDRYIYTNIGHTRFFTAVLQGDFALNNLSIKAGISYNKSIETISYSDNDTMQITPNFHYFEGNLNATYNIPKWNAGVAVFYKYTGSQPTLGGDITGGSIFSGATQDYHNIDASINKSFWKKRILVTAGVRNITNNVILNYSNATGTNGAHGVGSGGFTLTPGRTFFASLNLQFGE